MKGCAAAIMRIWLSTERKRLPLRPHGRGAVEHRQMLRDQPRRAFERHGPAGKFVGGLDLALAEADLGQEVEIGLVDAAPATGRACR